MRALALSISALALVGLLIVLSSWAVDESPSSTAPEEPRSMGVAAQSDSQRGPEAPAGSDVAASADPVPGIDVETSTDTVTTGGSASQIGSDSRLAFQSRIDGLLAKGDKAAFSQLLDGWRTGTLSREQERAIDDALASIEDAQLDELDKTVGRLLLDVPAQPERRRALASLLASSGTQLGVRYLIAAAAKPELRAQALKSLGTVSDPEVLPVYGQQINGGASPDLLDAISHSLRQMDTPKARVLEQQIQALG